VDDRKKGILFLCAGILCFALVWGLVRGFSGRWPWGTPTGVAGPSWSIRESMKGSPDALPQTQTETGKDVLRETPPEKWVIYLTGEVARPGILEVAPGSRLYEAVEAAGGLTPKADKNGINLAAKLSDGVHVHIPGIGEVPVNEGNAPSAGKDTLSRKGDPSPAPSAPIDINHAAAEELEALPGIGPKLARQIVEDRTANGPFSSREDLQRVKGIGPAKLERIKEMIVVRP